MCLLQDPKDNKLKQWLSQTAADGVFSGSFSLSDDPENGAWKIVASAKVNDKFVKINGLIADFDTMFRELVCIMLREMF